jgi:tetratricopeptide (TPR) repeat protein
MVFAVMEGWMIETLRGQLAACTAAHNIESTMMWGLVLADVLHEQGQNLEAVEIYEDILRQKNFWEDREGTNRNLVDNLLANLAVLYQDIGRHQDALVLLENSFEFRRRTLPQMDPELGLRLIFAVHR